MAELQLYIGGNPRRHLGYIDLVGRPSVGYVDSSKYGAHLGDKSYYILCHDVDYVHYAFVDKTYKCSDVPSMFAQLEFWLSVPKGMKLSSISPYKLLNYIHDKFVEQYTTRDIVNNPICKELEPKEYDKSLFESIIAQVVLADDRSMYVQMKGDKSGYIRCESDDKIDQLLSDTQYEEFRAFRDVIISTSCASKSEAELLSIVIPRPHKYAVYCYIDDDTREMHRSKNSLMYDTDSFDTLDILSDDQRYKYSEVRFTLGELKNAPDGKKYDGDKLVAELISDQDSIRCYVSREVRTYPVYLKTDIAPDMLSALANTGYELWFGNRQLQVAQFSTGSTLGSLTFDEIENGKKNIKVINPDGSAKLKLSMPESSQYILTLEMEIPKRSKQESEQTVYGVIGAVPPVAKSVPNDVVRIDVKGLPVTAASRGSVGGYSLGGKRYTCQVVFEPSEEGEARYESNYVDLSAGEVAELKVIKAEKKTEGNYKTLVYILSAVVLLLTAACAGLSYWGVYKTVQTRKEIESKLRVSKEKVTSLSRECDSLKQKKQQGPTKEKALQACQESVNELRTEVKTLSNKLEQTQLVLHMIKTNPKSAAELKIKETKNAEAWNALSKLSLEIRQKEVTKYCDKTENPTMEGLLNSVKPN